MTYGVAFSVNPWKSRNRYQLRGDVAVITIRHKSESFEALVDASDLQLVQGFTWRLKPRKVTRSTMYAATRDRAERKVVYLHRLLLSPPPGMVVDHINHNGLDNRRANLRVVTQSENNLNRVGADTDSRSGIRGVFFRPDRGKWGAKIKISGKVIWIGTFDNPEDAKAALQQTLAERGILCPQV